METPITVFEQILATAKECCCFVGVSEFAYIFLLLITFAMMITIIIFAIINDKKHLFPLVAICGIVLICLFVCNLWSSIVAIICCAYLGGTYMSHKDEKTEE
jgi:predicted branched-subunit amino acid permease